MDSERRERPSPSWLPLLFVGIGVGASIVLLALAWGMLFEMVGPLLHLGVG